MKPIKRFFTLALLLPVLLSLSCGKPKAFQKTSIAYFDTVITVTAYAESEAEFNALADEIFDEFARFHALYDIYQEYDGVTNLCTINKTAGDSPVVVDAQVMELLSFGKSVHALTNGGTNIAMGSVLSLWHEARKRELPPDIELLTEAAAHTDINDLVLDEEKSTVFFADPALLLDVGAIAKGYAAERIASDLEARGISGVLLNVGGNLIAVGNSVPWKVAVQHPETSGAYLQKLTLSEGTLVTSGSYQRYFIKDGVRYHHIIDPVTLYPKNEFLQVTVLCSDSGLADALSTALFNLSYEEGLALIETLDGAEALWYTADGRLLFSNEYPFS